MTQPRLPTPEATDLSARSRREVLSDAEQRALDQALESSSALRIAHRLGADFDAVLGVRSGDDESVARAAQRAVGSRRPARARRHTLGLVVAAALTCAVAASAGLWRLELHRSSSTAPGSPPPSLPARTSSTAPAPLRIAPLQAPSAASESAPAVRAAPARAPAASADSFAETARTVFSDANAARRDGDLPRARGLYAKLEREFPTSEEAHAARISLGKLLLGAGDAAGAERQFAQYLESGGTLSEEALVGRAQSLARLGRPADERAAWQAVLDRFPSSIYIGRAKARLSELDAR